MAPKPIRACGNVKDEPKVKVPERDTLAYKMAVEGVTSAPEYIAMIDRQVAEGGIRDNLANAIRLAVAERVADQQKYTFQQFAMALTTVVAELLNDPGFKASFDFAKANVDSLVDSSKAIREEFSGSARPVLTPGEEDQLKMVMAQLAADKSGDRDACLMSEVSRALAIVRENTLKELNVDVSNMSPLETMGIERMDIEAGDEDDDPSALHVDFEGLGNSLGQTLPEDILPDGQCDCDGSCKDSCQCNPKGA